MVQRMPEQAFPCNKIDGYLNCHHKTFIQQGLEADCRDSQLSTGLSSQSPTEEREEKYEQWVKTMMGKPTETADLS